MDTFGRAAKRRRSRAEHLRRALDSRNIRKRRGESRLRPRGREELFRQQPHEYAELRYIFERVGALIDQYAPREVALESPFFGENVQSMLKLGRAQGVAMAAALSRGLAVSEYAPMRIKQSITGRGSAAKEQVAAIVCRILSIDQPPRRLDATDGMAVALCHHFTTASPLNTALGDERVKGLGGGKKAASKRGSQSWEKFLKDHPDREIK